MTNTRTFRNVTEDSIATIDNNGQVNFINENPVDIYNVSVKASNGFTDLWSNDTFVLILNKPLILPPYFESDLIPQKF